MSAIAHHLNGRRQPQALRDLWHRSFKRPVLPVVLYSQEFANWQRKHEFQKLCRNWTALREAVDGGVHQ